VAPSQQGVALSQPLVPGQMASVQPDPIIPSPPVTNEQPNGTVDSLPEQQGTANAAAMNTQSPVKSSSFFWQMDDPFNPKE